MRDDPDEDVPGRLRLLFSLTMLAAALVGTAAVITLENLRDAAVGAEEAASPAVLHAARARALLADADRVAVQNLLPPKAMGGPGELFQDDIRRAGDALATAADDNAAGEDAGADIQDVNGRLVAYMSYIGQAHRYGTTDSGGSGNGDGPAVDLDVAYLSYAANLMYGDEHADDERRDDERPGEDDDIGILATVEEFQRKNREQLPDDGALPWLPLGVLGAAGLALLGLLGATHVFIARRFRRSVSPELVAAAVALLFIIGWTAVQTAHTRRALEATIDKTDEIACLWQVKTRDAVKKRVEEFAGQRQRGFDHVQTGRRAAAADDRCAVETSAGREKDGTGRDATDGEACPIPISAGTENLGELLAEDCLRPENALDAGAPGRGVRLGTALGALGIAVLAGWTFWRRAREYR